MDLVRRLLRLVLKGRYQFTEHAIESMDEDDLSLSDVISCLSGGRLRRTWKRQTKYEVNGLGMDGRRIRIVARLINGRLVRIITVYEVK